MVRDNLGRRSDHPTPPSSDTQRFEEQHTALKGKHCTMPEEKGVAGEPSKFGLGQE